ncbi:RND family transporter [Patescibacteria group bacterium]
MMKWLYKIVSKRPKLILVGGAVLTMIFIMVILGTRVQSNVHDFIDQKYIGPLDYINEQFGERDILSTTITAKDEASILSLGLLKEQDRFFNEIQEKWPIEVDGLTTVLNKHIGFTKSEDGTSYTIQNLISDQGTMSIIVDLYRLDPYEFERLGRKALSDDWVVDKLQELDILAHYTGDLPPNITYNTPYVKALRATIKTTKETSRDERREMFLGIKELSEDYSDLIDIKLYSTEIIEKEIDERVLGNSPFVIAFMIFLLAVVLFITFRSVFFTLVPIIVLSLAVFWAFGTVAVLGIKDVSFVHIIAIPLLLGQCIDNLIHFNERFREEFGEKSKKEAIKTVFITAGKAAGITTFLNMVAFSADIFTTDLKPVQEYALLIVLGLGIALVATYVIGASVLMISNLKVASGSIKQAEQGSNGARKLFDFIQKHKKIVLISSVLFLVLMTANILRIDTAFKSKSFMPENSKVYEAYQFEQDNFKLYLPHYVLLKGNVATQVALDAVNTIEKTLDGIDDIEDIHNRVNIESINYLLAKFDKDLFPESLNELYDMLFESDIIVNKVAQLEVQEVAPKIIEKQGNEYVSTLIKFWPAETDSFAIKHIADSVNIASAEFEPELDIQPTGIFLAFSRTMDDVLWSAVVATFITFSIILLFLWFIYKRFRTSLISVIPVIFGSSFGLGMLPILNIELNALNGTIAVLAMGLGIDYSIQIMNRYNEELGKNETPVKAMRETFGHIIVPLFQCVVLTTAGLFVLITLLPITGKFGIAAAVSLITGYLAAILIMPILAVKFIKTCPKSLKDKFK